MNETNQEAASKNPYAGARAVTDRTSTPRGFSGAVLDRLLENAHRDGRMEGIGVGRDAAEQRYADIWEEAFQSGLHKGREDGLRHMAQRCAAAMGSAREALIEIGGRTGSGELRALAGGALTALSPFDSLINAAMAEQQGESPPE